VQKSLANSVFYRKLVKDSDDCAGFSIAFENLKLNHKEFEKNIAKIMI